MAMVDPFPLVPATCITGGIDFSGLPNFFNNLFTLSNLRSIILEGDPLETLARDGQLMAYKHNGFWQCMDTLRDKIYLNKIWNEGNALWKKS